MIIGHKHRSHFTNKKEIPVCNGGSCIDPR